MDGSVIKSYFRKVPAVICTAGSYIASKNAEAVRKLSWLCEGAKLFEKMSPENILKYEAHFASARNGDAFSFIVNSAKGPFIAVAKFDSIYSKRFAEVLFFKNRSEMEAELSRDALEPSMEEKTAFAAVLLGIGEESFEMPDKRGLIDLKKSTAQLVLKIKAMGIPISYSETEEVRDSLCIPEDIPMVSYLQMVMLMAITMSSIGGGATVELRLHSCNERAWVVAGISAFDSNVGAKSCDELSKAFPAVSSHLSICSYIAGLYGCTLLLQRDIDAKTAALVLSISERPMFDVDFKSRDHLLYFDECFEFSKEYIMRLS